MLGLVIKKVKNDIPVCLDFLIFQNAKVYITFCGFPKGQGCYTEFFKRSAMPCWLFKRSWTPCLVFLRVKDTILVFPKGQGLVLVFQKDKDGQLSFESLCLTLDIHAVTSKGLNGGISSKTGAP